MRLLYFNPKTDKFDIFFSFHDEHEESIRNHIRRFGRLTVSYLVNGKAESLIVKRQNILDVSYIGFKNSELLEMFMKNKDKYSKKVRLFRYDYPEYFI